jgi:hypothetical protein
MRKLNIMYWEILYGCYSRTEKCIDTRTILIYCTILTVGSVTRHRPKKWPHFKSIELRRKFIGHFGDEIFRICEPTVEMVQYSLVVSISGTMLE